MKRRPLAELPNRVNIQTVTRPDANRNRHKATVTAAASARNGSPTTAGSLVVRASHPSSSGKKRATQLVNVTANGSKRNSAISTTSTNASSGRPRKVYIGHWQLGKTIGKGGCSKVREVRHRHTLLHGAVKIITREVAEKTRAQSLANLVQGVEASKLPFHTNFKPIPYGLGREIAVMKLLEHPNIVRLYDVWENSSELYLIMELVSGKELFTYVDQRKYLEEDETVYIFRQIVSALLYCHRLLICHRDLKPENIMLDEELNVKIIDFGMAALQPEGRLLSTPCGSPHYAAPEVISGKPYDGKESDVWSCGVILYVMLTGTTPFNYQSDGQIQKLFRDIKAARYEMPQELSLEAQDLIRRIFVSDPSQRITMDEVWDHPLLHKYDELFSFVGTEASKEAAIGPLPQLDRWKVSNVPDIDREILSNMRTLWHSEPESSLIRKLLNDEHNQEKLFYAALLKHREENLENFTGDAVVMGYSASDYHHGGASRPSEFRPSSIAKASRTQSQYSIMNDEHLRRGHSFVVPPPSISSYDPYRASRSPITSSSRDYMNVTIHRQNSNSTTITNTLPGLHSAGARRSVISAHNTWRSTGSGRSMARSGRSRSSFQRSSVSRSSLRSSHWSSSPPVVATTRPSDVHKRAVSFSHLRQTSTTSHSSGKNGGLLTPRKSRRQQASPAKTSTTGKRSHTPSPMTRPLKMTKTRMTKESVLDTPGPRAAKQTVMPDPYISSTVRKHSAELEKACEEAFFRSSVGSDLTVRNSSYEKQSFLGTPPTSIMSQEPPETSLVNAMARSLPPVPTESSNSHIIKTLEDARNQLASSRAKPVKGTTKYDEVMRAIDAFLDEPVSVTPLPMISEESDMRMTKENLNWPQPAVLSNVRDRKANQTVRMMPPSSPDSPAPLSIRKRAVATPTRSGPHPLRDAELRSVNLFRSQATLSTPTLLSSADNLVREIPVIRKKRSLWFVSGSKDGEGSIEPQSTTKSPLPTTPDDGVIHGQRHEPKLEPVQSATAFSEGSSEFPIRPKRMPIKKRVFAKWIGKLSRIKIADAVVDSDGSTQGLDLGKGRAGLAHLSSPVTVRPDPSQESLFSTPSSIDGPQFVGPERSWFARFFRIKPATAILCFQVPRTRARKETAKLLTDWQQYGVRDVQQHRESHTITLRVDKTNSLNIKPVTMRIEFFVVLERGHKSGLSIARFSQVKGAASSFRRVLEVIDCVMRGRGWLVEDEDKWRALCEIVNTT